MIQLAVYLAWYSLGLALGLAAGLGRRAALACSAAFLIGMASWVVLVTLALGLGLPYNAGSALALWALPLAGGIAIAVRRGQPTAWRGLAAGTAVALALMALACTFNAANLNYDSHKILALARGVGYRGNFDPTMWQLMGTWGSFHIISYSTASFLPISFMFSLAAVIWLALVATFAAGMAQVARTGSHHRRARWLVVLVTLALVSCFQFTHAATFIHNNLVTGALLFLFVLLFWLAETENDPPLLALAFLSAIALSFARLETPFVAAIFVLLTATESRLPRQAVLCGVFAFAAVTTIWLGMLSWRLPAQGMYLTTFKAGLWIAVIVFVTGYVAASFALGPLRRWNRYLPAVGSVAAAVALAVTFALEPEHMATATGAWFLNITGRWWGVAWIGALVAVLVMIPLPAPRFANPWRHGCVWFIAVIVLLAFVRIPYRHSLWDSGNRMMLHILPLVYFYIGLKLIPALSRSSE